MRLAPLSAATAAIALIGGWTLAAAIQPTDVDAVHVSISSLAAVQTPHRGIMTTALAVTGAAHLVTAWALGPAARLRGRLALGLAGVATLAVAALPLPSSNESSRSHVAAAGAAFALLAIWPLLAARPDGAPPLRPRQARAATVVLGLLVLSLPVASATDLWAFGALERVCAAALVLWPLIVSVEVWYAAGHPVGRPWVRRLIGVLALTLASLAGGVATTVLAPVSTQTTYYQAQISFDPDILHASRLQAQTVFGDLEVSFSGLAPGIAVTPQVKADIAQVLTQPDVAFTALQPSQHELSTAIRGAVVGLGIRFVVGAALVAALAALVVAALARRRPWPRLLLLVTLSWALALGVISLAVSQTYRPDRYNRYTGTGVLGIVQQDSGLLSDVEARSGQVTPYLRNLIALSTSLQQAYRPTQLEQPVALRLLFVSDLHDGNQYSLMKSIVTQEKVDAVVDLGDLVTFGTPQEAEAAGMFSGIASLGVPYLFVRGNHDATSPTDTALLTRLSQISNVVLLQGPSGNYTEVTINGVRIAGFNDPRYFGDDGMNSAEKEKPAKEAFAKAFADKGPVDLVVSHEPYAVQGLDVGGVLANGHMHVADLEGNRIQVGTFTGGGPFSHYIAESDGSELVGQPSAFDIATFGDSCRLTSLTRFTFRDLIEGRPAYDDVTLVNGSRIDTRPVDPTRTCSADATLTRTTVPSPAP